MLTSIRSVLADHLTGTIDEGGDTTHGVRWHCVKGHVRIEDNDGRCQGSDKKGREEARSIYQVYKYGMRISDNR